MSSYFSAFSFFHLFFYWYTFLVYFLIGFLFWNLSSFFSVCIFLFNFTPFSFLCHITSFYILFTIFINASLSFKKKSGKYKLFTSMYTVCLLVKTLWTVSDPGSGVRMSLPESVLSVLLWMQYRSSSRPGGFAKHSEIYPFPILTLLSNA